MVGSYVSTFVYPYVCLSVCPSGPKVTRNKFRTREPFELWSLVPVVYEARGLIKVYDTARWAHINIKLRFFLLYNDISLLTISLEKLVYCISRPHYQYVGVTATFYQYSQDLVKKYTETIFEN